MKLTPQSRVRLEIDVSGETYLASEGLRVVASLRSSNSQTETRSTVRVWNLSDARVPQLVTASRCRLFAGHGYSDPPLVAQGDVLYVRTEYADATDSIAHFEFEDGRVLLRDTQIDIATPSGVRGITVRSVLEDIANAMSLDIDIPTGVPFSNLLPDASFSGPAWQVLNDVLTPLRVHWYIAGGSVRLTIPTATQRVESLISEATGLIGHPTTTSEGARATMLLTTEFTPNQAVRVVSRTVDGIFTVKSIRHDIDSWEGTLRTELELASSP